MLPEWRLSNSGQVAQREPEYSRAFSGEILEEKISVDEMSGHDLLGTHGKILVIGGQELGENVMYGIAKAYGFVKKDFEYLDYDKVKGYMERICRNGKYRAVIFGASPHKTTGCLSSLI